MASDTDQAGPYDAVIAAIESGTIAMIPGVPQPAPKPMTFAQVEAFVVAHRLDPPTRLRCHPSVVNALRNTVPDDWPAPLPRPNLPQIEVVVDTGLPYGAWELLRGDEVIGRSEAT